MTQRKKLQTIRFIDKVHQVLGGKGPSKVVEPLRRSHRRVEMKKGRTP